MADDRDAKGQWIARVLGVDVGGRQPDGKGPTGLVDKREVAKRCLQLWLDAKETADAGISRLQKELQSTDDPMFLRIADRGLSAVSGKVQVGIRVGLEEFVRNADPAGPAAAKLAGSVADFRRFIENDPAVMLCDENPFGTDVGLRAIFGKALQQIDKELSALRG